MTQWLNSNARKDNENVEFDHFVAVKFKDNWYHRGFCFGTNTSNMTSKREQKREAFTMNVILC